MKMYKMLKDIYGQPGAMKACIGMNLSMSIVIARKIAAGNYGKIISVGCSTTGYIGIAARRVFEDIAGMPVENMPASEYADYPPPGKGYLLLAISRSGETGDILSAVAAAGEKGVDTLALVEVSGSTLAKKADYCIYTHAGREGMVSIKSYTNGIAALCLLALRLASVRKTGTKAQLAPLFRQVRGYPGVMREIIKETDSHISSLAGRYKAIEHIFLLGRGPNYATALEGMLMIKEASLVHAEAVCGGDLKHGHINAVNRNSLAVFIVPPGRGYSNMLGAIEDARRTGGKILVIGESGDRRLQNMADDYIGLSTKGDEMFSPVLYTLPLQLLAYHLAVKRGIDPDHGPGSRMVGGFYRAGNRIVYSIKKR